jgi:hypothetical protein
MSRLGRMSARLFLTLEALPTHLALEIKSSSIRIRAFSPQLRRERLQRLQNALALGSSARGHHARAKFLRRVGRRSEHRGIVVDPRIDEQHAVLRRAYARIVIVIIGLGGGGGRAAAASETVDPAGLDVDARDLGPVVRGEDRELYRAAPRIRGENRADVFVAWTPLYIYI